MWSKSLTEGPKILGPAVRNVSFRNYWLPLFVHPRRNANPGITLTNSVGRSPWQGWHEKRFHPYLMTVCSVSLSISIFRTFLLFFCYNLSLWSCLYVYVLHCWCRHTGRQSYITLPSELYRVIKKALCAWRLQYNHQVHRDFLITLYISTVFVHGTLRCYYVWLWLLQVIGFPLAWEELSNTINKEIYLGSKPKELTG